MASKVRPPLPAVHARPRTSSNSSVTRATSSLVTVRRVGLGSGSIVDRAVRRGSEGCVTVKSQTDQWIEELGQPVGAE